VIELVNWLICGTLIAAAMHAVSFCTPQVSASWRYRLWWVALGMILAAPVLPMLLPEHGVALLPAVQPLAAVEVPAATPFAAWLLVAVWAALALYALARIAAAAMVLRRRKREALPFPTQIENQLPLWNARLGSRAARLCVSKSVRSAAVLGGRYPAIAVSPGLLSVLTPRELDLVLMHEWAHVQRYDDAANAVQQVVCSVFGMHPGVRWCARQLDLQRELACDARVVSAGGSSRAYAACLARLAEMVTVGREVALAPSVLAGSHLTARVKAMLQTGPRVSRWHTCGFVTTGILVLIAVTASTARVAAVRGPVQTAAEIVTGALPQVAPASMVGRTIGVADVKPVSLRPRRSELPAGSRVRPNPDPSPDETPHMLPQSIPTPLSESASAVPELVTTEFSSGPGTIIPVEMPAAPEPVLQDQGTWAQVAGAGSTVGRKTSDAGVAIGRKSSDAARSTAGFFSKMGKSIAGRF
jgi:beta-lactamase regulating signal transducer with metallopeptidase domain